MRKPFKKMLLGVAACAALAAGGSAIAGAATSGTTSTTTTVASSTQTPPANFPAHGTAAHEDAEKASQFHTNPTPNSGQTPPMLSL